MRSIHSDRLLLLAIASALALSASCSNRSQTGDAAPSPKDDQAAQRSATYYTARQTFARLSSYRHSSPMLLWQVLPDPRANPGQATQRSYMVSGWVFLYEETGGAMYRASLDCWGGIKLAKEKANVTQLPGPIPSNEWTLDDIDAHRLALGQGGKAGPEFTGPALMAATVEGRGVRPVWRRWLMRVGGGSVGIGVDAQTGEIYPESSSGTFRAPASAKGPRTAEWDGGFRERSDVARLAMTRYLQWWPRAYPSMSVPFHRDGLGQYIYNRRLLIENLRAESAHGNRTAISQRTSATLWLVLGDYEQAIRDASLAVSLDRENEDSRFLRGLIAMLIREFDVAEADFRLLRPEYQRFVGDSMAAFEGLSDPPFNWELNLPTKFGKVSLCVQLGPVDMEAAGTQVQ